MEIRYFHRMNNRIETERVYGEGAVRWLYGARSGRLVAAAVAAGSLVSTVYGMVQNSPWSRRKIAPFVERFGIDLDEFLPGEGGTARRPYRSFNDFFIRKFKPGCRHFASAPGDLPAFCEGRYHGYDRVREGDSVPVKGRYLRAGGLLAREEWGERFVDGPLLLARLCPTDYHRFHFPAEGRIIDHYRIDGLYHSVNPLALKKKGEIFCLNKREVSILETEDFGKLAYVEIGALCVGAIVQTFTGTEFVRGQEKGYFLFGGSTVIVMGTAGAWRPSEDILENTGRGLETYVRLGDTVAN